ncbi:hypothetical protein TNCV_5116991 [Trichonephila clavipes]|nr:hypothetical protein TNCV_5116991 [Trichonephila clavipes]
MLSHADSIAALDYAREDPWREQHDRDGSIDYRLGLSQSSLLMNSSQHRCMYQAPASENQMQQRSLNSSLKATVGSPLVHLGGMLLNGSTSSLSNSPLQPSVTSITYGLWYTTFATSLILDGPILPCTKSKTERGSKYRDKKNSYLCPISKIGFSDRNSSSKIFVSKECDSTELLRGLPRCEGEFRAWILSTTPALPRLIPGLQFISLPRRSWNVSYRSGMGARGY